MSPWWIGVAACLLLSALATGIARNYALRQGLIDQPGPRRSHQQPTPRGGGMGMVLALLVGLIACWGLGWLPGWALALGVGAAAMGVLGWIDDHRSLSAGSRLLVQSGTAALSLYLVGGMPEVSIGPLVISAPWLLQPLAVLTLVWLTNLFNFMDGINGLTAAQSVFVATAMAVLGGLAGQNAFALASALVAAAAAGFLPWNFPRARIFMGDAGSAALGMCIGLLCVVGAHEQVLSPLVSALLIALFLVDATATLIWRFLKGDQWYTAHREHGYQRLVRSGLSHVQVTAGAMAINLLFIIPMVWLAQRNPEWEAALLAVIVILLTVVWWWTRTLKDKETT